MSTILKALKKAQGAGESRKAPLVSFQGSGNKGRLLLIPVAVCVVALGYFFAAFLLKGSTSTVAEVPGLRDQPAPRRIEAPAGADALNEQAMAHIKAGRLGEAEELLKEAISKHPGDPRLHNHLGLALKRQGRASEAISEYQKALERKPDYFVAMNNLAVALEAEGREAEAMERYETALAGDASLSGAHLNYALLLEKKGRAAEAEGHYRAFLELSGDESLKDLVRRRLRALD
jgi:tetratricopeptide (TPR) repeat protein